MGGFKTKKNPLKGASGGEGGIRTHGGFAPTPDFESGTFDHSATSPVCAIGGINRGYDMLRHTLVKPSILAETAIYLSAPENFSFQGLWAFNPAGTQKLGSFFAT